MVVRDFKAEDHDAVKKLAEAHKLNLSTYGKIIVVEAKDGEIKGFANIRPVFFITPFVSESPIYGYKLWEHIKKKSEEGGINLMQCYTEKKNRDLFEKLGFYEIFPEHIIMERMFLK